MPRPRRVRGVVHLEEAVAKRRLAERRVGGLRILVLGGQPLAVPAVPDVDVRRAARRHLALDHREGALVRVHVPRQHDVHVRGGQEGLHGGLHRVHLPVVRQVAVVPRRVQHDHQPRGPAPRHPRQVLLEPVVLRGGRGEGGIAAEEGEVHARRLEGVEQRGGGPARLVRHPVPREVALEEGEPRGALHLMISVGRHPRDLSSYGLQEARVRVPTRLEVVGVAQVAHVEDDVGPARPQVLEGRHRV
mmetsp:Transcript_1240/g.5043  ORF Transcript_1240/g.5043 Transcript_1240/m.5043 type:complete len:246 (-) Transcript_1240:1699-2436(-)